MTEQFHEEQYQCKKLGRKKNLNIISQSITKINKLMRAFKIVVGTVTLTFQWLNDSKSEW